MISRCLWKLEARKVHRAINKLLHQKKVHRAIRRIWRLIPVSFFWCLWTERNRRCFDGVSTPNHSIKARCLMYLFSLAQFVPCRFPWQLLPGPILASHVLELTHFLLDSLLFYFCTFLMPSMSLIHKKSKMQFYFVV